MAAPLSPVNFGSFTGGELREETSKKEKGAERSEGNEEETHGPHMSANGQIDG